MQQQDVGVLALQSLTMLSLAMGKLEVGEVGICAVHNGMRLIHDFKTPLTTSDTPFVLSQFDFTYQDTHSSDLVGGKVLILHIFKYI